MKRVHVAVLLALLVAVVASAVAVVWARQSNRTLFMELTQLQARRDKLNVTFGQLELEQATLADPTRIEKVARGQLDMVAPDTAHLRLIRQ